MKTFPMFLQMAGRRVVIAGGGEQAAQKTRLMLKTEARIDVLCDVPDEELAALARDNKITHVPGQISPDTFADTALVFIATGCPAADSTLQTLAKISGATVNVVDQPWLCDAITPSIVDRDPVVVAIGTEGTAPVLARQIKTRMEGILEPHLGDLAALAGRLRGLAAARLTPRRRRDLWRWVFNDAPRMTHARGAHREAAALVKSAIKTGDFDGTTTGSVALIAAGPGAADLMTLRGVQRLQEADVIYCDPEVNTEILDLARRDAERVVLGAAQGCHTWPRDKTLSTLVNSAQHGKRIAYLVCAEAGSLTQIRADLSACDRTGMSIEIVPGVAGLTPAETYSTRTNT